MRKLSLWELYKLAFSLIAGVIPPTASFPPLLPSPPRDGANVLLMMRTQVLLVDEDDLKLIEQMRVNGGDMLTTAMRQFADEYPVAANVRCIDNSRAMFLPPELQRACA